MSKTKMHQKSLLFATLAVLCMVPAVAADETADKTQFDKGVVYLEADEMFQDTKTNRYVARGNVEARYQTRILRADEVIYFPDENKVHARGSVVVVEDDGTVEFADEVELNDDLATGVALGFFARLDNNATIGASHATHSEEGRLNTLKKAFYTACPSCVNEDGSPKAPTWQLRAREAEQNLDDQMIYYRDAVFELKGVPIFYTPYFAHADPTAGRHSGLLFPNVGQSSKYGFYYEQPYYKVLSPYSDLTITPRVFTGVRPLVFGEYRKRFYSGAIQVNGAITHERDFDGDGLMFGNDRIRGYALGEGKFRLNQNWYWGFGAEYVSDDLLFRRYDLSYTSATRGLFRNSSLRLSNQLFAVGQDKDYFVSVAGVRYQGLRSGDVDNQLPIAAPLIDARKILPQTPLGGKLTVGLNTAVLNRIDGIDSRRASTSLDWNRRLVSKQGIIVKPFLSGRADFYNIDNQDYFADLGTTNQSFGRVLGVAGAEIRWPWLKAGKNVNWIVEPIVHLSASPEGDGIGTYDRITFDNLGNTIRTPVSLLPNEDSITADFDESNLFRSSRFSGYDAWEDGLRASVGGRISARWGEKGFASLEAGRAFRTETNTDFSPGSSLQGKSSDYVAGLNFSTGGPLSIGSHIRLDQDDFGIRRFDVLASSTLSKEDMGKYSLGLHSIRNSILYTNAPASTTGAAAISEITFSNETFLSRNWGARFNIRHNFERDETQQYSAGLVYDDRCSRFELMFQHDETLDRGFQSGDSIRFRFTLTTLGTFGN
jgi:LPS-assembly protein